MLFTGGLAERREVPKGSLPAVSSDHMSPLSSDISTNSNAKIFLTILGGSEAAGLYGPAVCRASDTSGGGSISPGLSPWVPPDRCWRSAAAARMSRPDANPVPGVNAGRGGRSAGFGSAPSSVPG